MKRNADVTPTYGAKKKKFNKVFGAGDFQCAICLELLLDPCVGPCGHDFCSHCLCRWRMAAPTLDLACPICRETIVPLGKPILAICRRLKFVVEHAFPVETARRRAEVILDHQATSGPTQPSASPSTLKSRLESVVAILAAVGRNTTPEPCDPALQPGRGTSSSCPVPWPLLPPGTGWQHDGFDLPLRRQCAAQLVRILQVLCPRMVHAVVGPVVAELLRWVEAALYRTASTRQAYCCWNTLDDRLHVALVWLLSCWQQQFSASRLQPVQEVVTTAPPAAAHVFESTGATS